MLAIIVFVGSTYPLNVEKENTENELTVKENFPLLRTQNERRKATKSCGIPQGLDLELEEQITDFMRTV